MYSKVVISLYKHDIKGVSVEKINWQSSKRNISELTPAKYNPREMTVAQEKELNKSLSKFSLADPIVINQDNKIIGGHQRIKLLKTQGIKEVDVRVPERLLSPEEEKELNLRLNRNVGEWNYDLLAEFSEDMLADVGFDSEDLDKIFAKIHAEKEK